MIFKNIHVLTKQDLSVSTGNHEPRLDTSFEQHVSNINEQLLTAYVTINNNKFVYQSFVCFSNFPFIIVGVSSNPKDVSPRIQHCFLHEITINPPTQEQRTQIIKGLTLNYPISRGEYINIIIIIISIIIIIINPSSYRH